jgi:C_GCAxxG_C_C family probable redox protein
MRKIDRAISLFASGFSCSQSVLAAFGPSLGLDEDTCLRIASPFGAGMGRMQETCGAVTGAFMAIGLKYGKGLSGSSEDKDRSYALARELSRLFCEKHGTMRCRDLLGCDMNTNEGRKHIQEKDLFKTLCPLYVKEAVQILEKLLKET